MARTLIKAAYDSGGTEYVYQVVDIMNPCIKDATIELAKIKVGADIILRDGSVAMTGNLNLGSQKVTNMADGTVSGDAVTFDQLQAAAGGLDVKEACAVATIAALPAYAGGGTGTLTANVDGALVLDGYAVQDNDRVLVKNENGEAADVDNGIYVATNAGDPYNAWVLTRSTDADQDAEVTHGLFCFISNGDTQQDSGWSISTNDPITVNTTPIQFTQFHSAGVINAGEGLRKEGNTIHVNFGDGTQYCSICDGISIDPSDFIGSGLEIITDTLGDGWDDIHVKLMTSGGIGFNTGDSDSLYVDVSDFAGNGLEATGGGPFYTLDVDILANAGLKFAGGGNDELAVEPSDFAGGGITETGSSDVIQVDFISGGGLTFHTGGGTPNDVNDQIKVLTTDFDGDGLTTDSDTPVPNLKVHVVDEAGGTGGLTFQGTSPNKQLLLKLDTYGDQVLSLGHASSDGLAIAMPDGYILVGNGASPSLAKAVQLSGDATIDNTGAITVSDGVAKKDDYIANEYIAAVHNSAGPYYIGGGASPGYTVDASTVMVFLNGVLQEPGAGNDYQLTAGGGANNVINFTFNLKSPGGGNADKILVTYFKESTP